MSKPYVASFSVFFLLFSHIFELVMRVEHFYERFSLDWFVLKLCRYLQHLGYEVTYVRNFTDVDDKVRISIIFCGMDEWLLIMVLNCKFNWSNCILKYIILNHCISFWIVLWLKCNFSVHNSYLENFPIYNKEIILQLKKLVVLLGKISKQSC